MSKSRSTALRKIAAARTCTAPSSRFLEARPKLIKAATNPDLRASLTEHKAITEKQVERLDQIYQELGKRARRARSARALQTTLNEEGEADHRLTDLAEECVNIEAMKE